MSTGKKIGCIGTGNMGSAIIIRLSKSQKHYDLSAYDIDGTKLKALSEKHEINTADSEKSLVENSDIIILAVKPDSIETVLYSIKGSINSDQIFISIAAGIKIKKIEQILGESSKIVRVMPNTPSIIGEGISVISPNKSIDDKMIKNVEEIFLNIGKVITLPEKLMDAVTGVSGSGPAYVFTFIQAMTDGAVKMGIPRDKALILASQTVLGSAKLIIDNSEDPMQLRDKVTSPGGTTISAIHVLERAGFSGIIIDAIEAAVNKSRMIGEK